MLNLLESESIFSAHEVEETDRKNSCCFPTKKSVYTDKEEENIGMEYNTTQKEARNEEPNSDDYDSHFLNSKEGGYRSRHTTVLRESK